MNPRIFETIQIITLYKGENMNKEAIYAPLYYGKLSSPSDQIDAGVDGIITQLFCEASLDFRKGTFSNFGMYIYPIICVKQVSRKLRRKVLGVETCDIPGYPATVIPK
jgi:hypothetical protein